MYKGILEIDEKSAVSFRKTVTVGSSRVSFDTITGLDMRLLRERGALVKGYVSLDRYKKVDMRKPEGNVLVVEGGSGSYVFDIMSGRKLYAVRYYIRVGSGEYLGVVGFNWLLYLLLVILLGVLVWLLFREPVEETSSIHQITIAKDESDIFSIKESGIKQSGQIEIPGFSNLMISKDSLVQLKNPEGNEVYLKYTVSEGDTVIYESDYISPGESVAWHAGEDLEGLGEHDLSFFVSTLSVSTLEPKNTATILVKANVD